MTNLFLNINTNELIDITLENNSMPKNYISNNNIEFYNNFFLINYKKKKYIPKSYMIYKKILNNFNFLKNRSDINLYIDDDVLNNFIEYKAKEISEANIYQYMIHMEGNNMSVFKFQITREEGIVYFAYPLPLDNKFEDFYIDRKDVLFIDSVNTYNLICGLLKEDKLVYTTVDRLANLSMEDIMTTDKLNTSNTNNMIYDDYMLSLNLFITEFVVSKLRMMDKNYFQFNLLLNYFLSKNIHINMFQKSIEDIYESVIETIDKLDDIEIEEDLLDKLEELLLLKNKIDFSIRIENIYNTLKKELLDDNISKEEKEQKLENGKLELKTLFELNKQQLDKR